MAKPAPLPPCTHHATSRVTKQLRDLWADWNATISECGGWTVSRPDIWPIQFEVQFGSDLPEQIEQIGHTVKHVGFSQRCLPTAASQNPAPQRVIVFELKLPGQK